MASAKRKIAFRIIAGITIVLLLSAGAGGYLFWRAVYKNNAALPANAIALLFLKTGSDYNDLLTNIIQHQLLKNPTTFNWLALRKNLPNHIYPGRYEIKAGMNNDEIINMLRSGAQTPLRVTFNNLRTIQQLAGVIAKQIEADSASIVHYVNSAEFREKYNLNIQNAPVLFIPWP